MGIQTLINNSGPSCIALPKYFHSYAPVYLESFIKVLIKFRYVVIFKDIQLKLTALICSESLQQYYIVLYI